MRSLWIPWTTSTVAVRSWGFEKGKRPWWDGRWRLRSTQPPGGGLLLHTLPRKKSEVTQSHLALCDPMDGSLPGSSLHGVLQARVLEWVAISFPRGSSQPRDQTYISYTAGKFFTTEPPGKPTQRILVEGRKEKKEQRRARGRNLSILAGKHT